MKPWKTVSRHTILNHSKYLIVENHTVELPDGKIIPEWPWLVMPDYLNVLAMTASGEFLCFRQTKYGLKDISLAPVGGYIEVGEDPLTAAKRELLEETGYQAPVWIDLGHYVVDANRGAGTAYLFLARDAYYAGKVDVHNDDLEEQELIYLTYSEVKAALEAGDFKLLSWATVIALALRHIESS